PLRLYSSRRRETEEGSKTPVESDCGSCPKRPSSGTRRVTFRRSGWVTLDDHFHSRRVKTTASSCRKPQQEKRSLTTRSAYRQDGRIGHAMPLSPLTVGRSSRCLR